jgi:Asp-tRNA(Asn)/Glu-tRNA(Gln) amidotransferase A subunit family amidase
LVRAVVSGEPWADRMTLAEIVADLRARRVSSQDLVRSSLERIDRLDGEIGAVVALREEALADARAIDEDGSFAGPLCGLPLLVKDTENVAGMRTTFGSLLHVDDPPASFDDLSVERLRAAGAIVVGKTNVPEFAFEGFTSNRVFGDTRNPWAPEWSPGGSSGGSGAALAMGLAPIATATDGGGSVRIPAAFCGLAGLKPTNGLIGRRPVSDWMDLSTPGALAPTIADVRLLLDVLRGPVAGDPTAAPSWQPGPLRKPARILATPRLVDWGPLPDGIGVRFRSALERLEAATGVPIVEIQPSSIFHSGNPDDDWIMFACVDKLTALGRETLERTAERLTSYFLGAMRYAERFSLDDYVAARRRRFEYTREMDELLGDDAVLVCPTMCVEGLPADGRMLDGDEPGTDSEAYNTQVANLTGHPALSVPAGVSPNEVPFGLQITGPRFADDLVLSVGEAWESSNPWPPTARGYEPFGI